MNTKIVFNIALNIILLFVLAFGYFSDVSGTFDNQSALENFPKRAYTLRRTFMYVEPKQGSFATYYIYENISVMCQDKKESGYAYCAWNFNPKYEAIYGWIFEDNLRYK